MKSRLAVVLVALSIIAGVGVGFLVQRLNDGGAVAEPPSTQPSTQPSVTPSATPPGDVTPAPTPSSSPSDGAPGIKKYAQPGAPTVEENRNERMGASWSPADVVGPDGKPLAIGPIVPGGFAPVMVGELATDVEKRGYLVRDTPHQVCEGDYWLWPGQLSQGMDALPDTKGRIATMSTTRDGLETADGIAVGNSLQALQSTYGDRVSKPRRAGYDQAGVFLRDGTRWIGFLFQESLSKLTPSSRVFFIEVTEGERPSLMRDGC